MGRLDFGELGFRAVDQGRLQKPPIPVAVGCGDPECKLCTGGQQFVFGDEMARRRERERQAMTPPVMPPSLIRELAEQAGVPLTYLTTPQRQRYDVCIAQARDMDQDLLCGLSVRWSTDWVLTVESPEGLFEYEALRHELVSTLDPDQQCLIFCEAYRDCVKRITDDSD